MKNKPDYKAEFDFLFGGYRLSDPSASDPLAEQLRLESLGRWHVFIKEHWENRGQHMPAFFYDYIENPILNLWADYIRASHCGYIAIHTAAVPILYDLFYRLLSSPNVLPDIGNASAEAGPLSLGLFIDYRDIVANRPVLRQSLSDAVPLDPGRKRYAESLAEIALAFFVHHELAHITLGHCEYVKPGGTPLMELSSASASGNGLVTQTLEISADCAASVATYIRVLAKTTDRQKSDRAVLEAGNVLVVPDHLIIFDWVFAMYVMFWAFTGDIDVNRLDTASHPSPPRRATRAFNCVYLYLKNRVGEDARISMMKECERAINAGADALNEITGDKIKTKLFQYQILEENKTMAQHFQRLANKWNEIKADVEKYKHDDM